MPWGAPRGLMLGRWRLQATRCWGLGLCPAQEQGLWRPQGQRQKREQDLGQGQGEGHNRRLGQEQEDGYRQGWGQGHMAWLGRIGQGSARLRGPAPTLWRNLRRMATPCRGTLQVGSPASRSIHISCSTNRFNMMPLPRLLLLWEEPCLDCFPLSACPPLPEGHTCHTQSSQGIPLLRPPLPPRPRRGWRALQALRYPGRLQHMAALQVRQVRQVCPSRQAPLASSGDQSRELSHTLRGARVRRGQALVLLADCLRPSRAWAVL